MTEKQVTVKNLQVNYKIIGQGPPLRAGKPMLILHGRGSSSGRWERTAELLLQASAAAFEEGHMQVIIPDLPGFGATPGPAAAWNMDNYVDWLHEFVEKAPELHGDFYLVGHSFGGALAAKFAIKYNQNVKMLFLVSAACIRKNTWIKKLLYRVSKIVKVFSFVPGYSLARKAFYKFILKKSDYLHITGVMQETYLRLISEDLSWRLPSLKVKTIIIWGDKDDLTPIAEAHIVHEKIPNSQLIILPGGPHGLQIKMPELLVEKIISQLNGA